MHIADAMEIVLDLAKLSVAHFPNVPDPEQREAREALALVEDFVVNQLGDDGDETEENVGVHVWKGASVVDDCSLCGRRYADPCHGYVEPCEGYTEDPGKADRDAQDSAPPMENTGMNLHDMGNN